MEKKNGKKRLIFGGDEFWNLWKTYVLLMWKKNRRKACKKKVETAVLIPNGIGILIYYIDRFYGNTSFVDLFNFML